MLLYIQTGTRRSHRIGQSSTTRETRILRSILRQSEGKARFETIRARPDRREGIHEISAAPERRSEKSLSLSDGRDFLQDLPHFQDQHSQRFGDIR